MKPDEVEPGSYVAPNKENPWPVAAPVKPDEDVAPMLMDRDMEHRIPEINLLANKSSEAAPVVEEVKQEVPPVIAAPLPEAQPTTSKRKRWPVAVGVIAILMVGAGAAAYFVIVKKPAPANIVATHSANPTAVASPSPTPSPSPSATPILTPTPSATPGPTTVTVPTTAPTSSKPQTVIITSKSGLWLRSTPNSSNNRNIIDWMADGSEVSVDSIGSFWWHGTYKGRAGYFASKYTQ